MTLTTLAAGICPLSAYGAALRRAAAGIPTGMTVVDNAGRVGPLPVDQWYAEHRAGDETLLARCDGPTIDLGCGPGRLTAALVRSGRVALGVDACRDAVRLARRRGAPAVCRDIFGRLPREGRWPRLILADGNIGIGGDPESLLRRCRAIAAPDGQILVEVDPPGSAPWSGPLRIAAADGTLSAPFAWARIGVDDLTRPAHAAGLRVRRTWTESRRWFACLSAA